MLECGELPSAVEYLEAQQVRRALRQDLQQTFKDVDALVGPTMVSRTPTISELSALVNDEPVIATDSMIRLVGPASLLGLPCLSLPCGLADGLPVGLQVIGPALGEQKVLDVGTPSSRPGRSAARGPQLVCADTTTTDGSPRRRQRGA